MKVTADDITWDLAPPAPDPFFLPEDALVEALVEAQAYRVLAQQAIHALHVVTLERDVLQEPRVWDRRR